MVTKKCIFSFILGATVGTLSGLFAHYNMDNVMTKVHTAMHECERNYDRCEVIIAAKPKG